MDFQLKTTLKYQTRISMKTSFNELIVYVQICMTLNIENEFLSKSLFEIEVFSLQV